jgi:beta-ribofuranosylaminobenzene 5'-phosphate synthase
VRQPQVVVRVTSREPGVFTGQGRMSDRAVVLAQRFAEQAAAQGLVAATPGAHVHVLRVPRPHTGLGSGTQLGLAVARAMAAMLNLEDLDADALAGLVDRGRRSAIGAHGAMLGGLIVDGGKSDTSRLAPMVVRLPVPEDWRIVLIRPAQLVGLAGQRELQAFAELPPIDQAVTARMCQLVLMGMLPAVVERDLEGFGQSLFELQQLAGQCFKEAQGGIYSDPMLDRIVAFIRGRGIRGVGQSSWGPTLYAILGDQDAADALAHEVQRQFGLEAGEVMVTAADNRGSVLSRQPVSA